MTSTLVHQSLELHSAEGEKLRSDLRYVETGRPKPFLLFLHGFKGFKDWGPFPLVCERFAEQHFVTLSFNFSHNGIGDFPTEFTELDRFANNTVSRELGELKDVLGAVVENKLPIAPGEIDIDKMGIIGHSRGAALAILAGRHYHEIKAVSAWAPVARFDRFTPRQKDKWREEGFLEVMNQRTGQRMRMNASFLTDLEVHKDRLDILRSAALMTGAGKKLQILTGSEDLTAPPKEAQEIYLAANKANVELQIIERTGHTFGVEHPFKGTTPAFERTMALTLDFFKTHFAHLPPG